MCKFMKISTIKLTLILTVLSCVSCESTVAGYVGGNASINCPSEKGYEFYPKCLHQLNGRREVILSDGYAEWTHSGRVSLQDKKNNFTVTIHNLELKDSGTYRCVFKGWWLDHVGMVVDLLVAEIRVSGYERATAIINCSSVGYKDYPKYLWKGNDIDGVKVIQSDGYLEWTHRGRFTLQDKKDRNIFTVIIHDLTLEDAGIYGCGVNTWGEDPYTRVFIIVDKKPETKATRVVARVTLSTTSATVSEFEKTTHLQTDLTSASGPGPSLHVVFITTVVFVVIGLLVVALTFRLMRNRDIHRSSRALSSGAVTLGDSKDEAAEYPQDPQDPNTFQMSSLYQSQNTNTTQPDAVYQSLDTNTTQPDAVYQSLDTNTTQPDAVYQNLDINTTQPDAVYQSLDTNTTQPDAVNQNLDTNTTQPYAVYQRLNPQHHAD